MLLITWLAKNVNLDRSQILTDNALVESEGDLPNSVRLQLRNVSWYIVSQRLRGLFECLGVIERIARVQQHRVLICVERAILLVPFREPGSDLTTQRVKLVLVRDQEHVPNGVDGHADGTLVSATMEDLKPDSPASRIISIDTVGGLASIEVSWSEHASEICLIAENLLRDLELVELFDVMDVSVTLFGCGDDQEEIVPFGNSMTLNR